MTAYADNRGGRCPPYKVDVIVKVDAIGCRCNSYMFLEEQRLGISVLAATLVRRAQQATITTWPTIRSGLPWLLIALGVALRCVQYLHNRSLFLDEVLVASNIAEKSFGELLRPLLFDQRAPAGFLWGVKSACLVFGQSDLTLRLLPLLAGIVSLLVFYEVAKRYLSRGAVLLAVALYALSASLIFYASDLKQYSTEVLVCLVILWTFSRWDAGPLSVGRIIGMGLVGAVGVWFSFTAVFVLVGIAACVGVSILLERRWSALWRFALVGCIWAIGFGALHVLQLRFFDPNPAWKVFWYDHFMPSPLRFYEGSQFLAVKAQYLVAGLVGLGFSGIGLVAVFFGAKSLFAVDPRRLALLVSPVVVTLVASVWEVYPFQGRVILFLAPIPLLLMAEGIYRIGCWNVAHARLLATCMAVLLVAQPAFAAVQHLSSDEMYVNPLIPKYQFEEAKPVMAYMRDHWQQGDTVYLYSQSYIAFEYYAAGYGFQPEDSEQGILTVLADPAWPEIRADLQRLQGRGRVWVFFCHLWPYNGVDEQKLYLHFLDDMGQRLDQFETPAGCDASAFLYDLSL